MSVSAIRIFRVLLISLACLRTGGEDIDLFTRDLDLSGLQMPGRSDRQPSEANRNLFEAWGDLPEALRSLETEEKAFQMLTLPYGPFLAVPNPLSLPEAIHRLKGALEEADLTPLAPLVVLIHADDNISVGCRVAVTESRPLPLGTDLSSMPARRLLVTAIEADTARRTEPALVQAAARLRRYAMENSLTVQTRELYLIPIEPGRILFGLLIGE
jgi:hypothetical protein